MCDLLALNRHLWQICDLTALIEHLPNSCVTYLHSMNHCLIWSIMVSLMSGPSVSLIFSLIVPRACWYSFSWFPCVMRLVASVFRAKAWGVFLILVGKGGGAYVTKMFENWTYIVVLLFSLQPYFYLPGNTFVIINASLSLSSSPSLPLWYNHTSTSTSGTKANRSCNTSVLPLTASQCICNNKTIILIIANFLQFNAGKSTLSWDRAP